MTDAATAVPRRFSRRANSLALLALIALAGARVVATYGELSATADEMQHVAAGLDWIEGGGAYTLWRDQGLPHVIVSPPLARIAIALGPYIAGLRLTTARALLYSGSGPARNLALARAGVLPFLALAIIFTWALARRALEDDCLALVATAIFSFCPVLLGHAGLATTDVAFTAMTSLVMLTTLRWLERPTSTRASTVGVALGLAFATKLSGAVLALSVVVAVLVRRRVTGTPLLPDGRRRARQGLLMLGPALLIVFAAYAFHVGRPREQADPAVLDDLIGGCFSSSAGRRVAHALANTPLPAPALFNGLVALCAQNAAGRSTAYLLGRISQDGFPLFFPVALAVKTPLPLLALAALGIAVLLRRGRAARARVPVEPAWTLFAIPWLAATFFGAAVASRVNIGVRHLLPIYPLLAILATVGLTALGSANRPRLGRVAALALAGWACAIPFFAAPDYMAWFNVLAGRHPENVLLDSDLDWGQDLWRLERALAERHVGSLALAYFGPADLCREPLPAGHWLRPHERVTGFVAVSEMYRKGVVGFYYRDGNYCDPRQLVSSASPDPSELAWLDAYTPVARVGKSMLLYDLPEERQ